MVTRNDVARLAGVSPAVVSYVINNSNYVSAEKRKAVLDAIKELNYIPNVNAKNLRQGRTNMIAVVRGSVLNDLFSGILLDLEQIAGQAGFLVTTVSTVNNTKSDDFFASDAFIETLISRHYDAVFISNSALTEAQLNRLAENTKVLLFVSRQYYHLNPEISQIIPDYRNAVHALTKKLLDLGHRRIALLPNLSYPMTQQSPDNFRFLGYKDAFTEAGLPIDLNYVPDILKDMDAMDDFIADMFFNKNGIPKPTAVITDEAFILARLMKRLRTRDIKVPRDVSLGCFSRSTIVDLVTPTLTSTGFDTREFSTKAFRIMEDMIIRGESRRELIPMTYTDGDSIGPVNE